MAIDQQALKDTLRLLVEAVAQLPRADGKDGRPKLGFHGDASPLRTAMYFEFQTESGIHVADPAALAHGVVALREWITVRGGQAGGRESVKPGGSGLDLGGLGLASILRLITGLGVGPGLNLTALRGQLAPLVGTGGKPSPEALQQLLRQLSGSR